MFMNVHARNWTLSVLLQSVSVDIFTRILGTRIVPITRNFIKSIEPKVMYQKVNYHQGGTVLFGET